MPRRLPLLFLLITVSPAAAQTTLAAGPEDVAQLSPLVTRALDDAALKDQYRVRLTSDWPQFGTPASGCVNGGVETIEGTLRRTADSGYSGTLTRRTTIQFCGSHGKALDGCSVTLRGEGPVVASADVTVGLGEWGGHPTRLRWIPNAEETRGSVEGDCPEQFTGRLLEMYRSAPHSVEFLLPPAGKDLQVQHVRDYGWVVEVR